MDLCFGISPKIIDFGHNCCLVYTQRLSLNRRLFLLNILYPCSLTCPLFLLSIHSHVFITYSHVYMLHIYYQLEIYTSHSRIWTNFLFLICVVLQKRKTVRILYSIFSLI